MEVKWKNTEDELPPEDMYSTSRQVVIKSRGGYLGTGYYLHKRRRWELDGLIAGRDYVEFWLDGLS